MNTYAEKNEGNKIQAVANGIKRPNDHKSGLYLVDNRPKAIAQRKMQESIHTSKVSENAGDQVIQGMFKTRGQIAAADAMNPDGIEQGNIVHGPRPTAQPNRLGSAPALFRNRQGVPLLNPGSAEITREYMKLSGDSMKDIAYLVAKTGRGGPGPGEVWHHMGDFNQETGEGTVILMDQAVHAGLHHHGGSAMARAHMFNDPDKKAKYGQT